MSGIEYKVVPAPMRGLKGKGIKGTPARFANALQSVMNDLGADGWEYQRTDTLPVEERQGLTGKSTSFQNMLVFRRALVAEVEDTPGVAALIEDKSEDIVPEAPVEVVEDVPADEPTAEVTEDEDLAAQHEDVIPKTEVDDLIGSSDDELANVRDRVSETLEAPSFFQWRKRRQASEESHDTFPRPPAE